LLIPHFSKDGNVGTETPALFQIRDGKDRVSGLGIMILVDGIST
jgi:hypothetical protein